VACSAEPCGAGIGQRPGRVPSFLKSPGLAVLWLRIECLVVYGAVVLGLSTARFHKKPD